MILRIPIVGQQDLPWGWFVLQAARGAVQVPDWLWLAIPGIVGARLGVSPDEITEDHIDRALALLPDDPRPVLARLLGPLEVPVPDPTRDPLRLDDESPRGTFREAVDQHALAHDAALILLGDYGPGGFFACTESVEEERWDARGAVAAMMYLLVLHLG